MYRILFALLLVLLAQTAFAQDTETDTDESAADAVETVALSTFFARGFGFAIDLPDSGSITTPADEDWDQPEEVAVQWRGDPGDPVEMINVRVDSFGADLDDELFDKYCEVLLANWSDDPENFKVVTPNTRLTLPDGTSWNLIEISDLSNAEGKAVHYSVFCRYAGDKIFTVTMYYLDKVDDEVRAFGSPIYRSLQVL